MTVVEDIKHVGMKKVYAVNIYSRTGAIIEVKLYDTFDEAHNIYAKINETREDIFASITSYYMRREDYETRHRKIRAYLRKMLHVYTVWAYGTKQY